MDPASLTYSGRLMGVSGSPPAGMASPLQFKIATSARAFRAFVWYPQALDRLGTPEQVHGAVASWAVGELVARIRSGEHEALSGSEAINMDLIDERAREVASLLDGTAEKECGWQRRESSGLVCDATSEGQDRATTRALCRSCAIPDGRSLCSELVHPRIRWIDGDSGVTRQPERVLCGEGRDPGDGTHCRPGGLECWRRDISSDTVLPGIPEDLPRVVAEELDYFRLVVRDRYPEIARPVTIPEARSIAEMFGTCASAEEFQRRVSSLADLLTRVDVYDALEAADREGPDGKRVGPLVALERLMARDYPEATTSVKRLRAIPKARTSFPVHSRSEGLLEAFRTLGVDFPTDDWGFAWSQVLRTFWSSIREVRRSMQSATPAGSATKPT